MNSLSSGAARLIDLALDRTVVLGYGAPGLAIRRRLPGWPPDPPRLDGHVALVTGAAAGLGLAAAVGFARLGATVVPVARNPARAQSAVDQILSAVPEAKLEPEACDVSSLSELRALAARRSGEGQRLDLVVNCAGVMPDLREFSADGHELSFATHVLAPFALTKWLRAVLERSAPSTVVDVSSGGMYTQQLPADDFEGERLRYSPKRFYARTKREQVVISEMWAEKLRDTGIAVHAMHPGWADTPGVRRWMPGFRRVTAPLLRDAAEGADTIVWLGAAPQAHEQTGGFWHDRRPRPTSYLRGATVTTDEDAQHLWDYCEAAIEGVVR